MSNLIRICRIIGRLLFKPTYKVRLVDNNNIVNEVDTITKKREEAIKILGDRALLKGGVYSKYPSVLKGKV